MASEGVYTATPLELVLGTFSTSVSDINVSAGSAGTAKTVSRGDHVHKLAVAAGTSNGQIKIGGTDYTIKGLAAGVNAAGTAGRLAYYSSTAALSQTFSSGYGGVKWTTATTTASTATNFSRLHLFAQTVGNTAATMVSGTAGLFSFGDSGPQITFDTSETPGSGQAGALIFTDHDTAATGASWHFVSNQGDWNVTSKRFHARTSISIGTNLPNTSYNLYVSGSTYHTGTAYFGGNITTGNTTIYCGSWTANTAGSGERQIGVADGAGKLYMYSVAATTGNRGMYQTNAAGTSGTVFSLNQSNQFNSFTSVACNITMTGNYAIVKGAQSKSWYQGRESAIIRTTAYSGYQSILSMKTTNGDWSVGVYTNNIYYWTYFTDANYNANTNTVTRQMSLDTAGKLTTASVVNAVWNDYAEYRASDCEGQFGRCVIDQDDGKMILADKRLLPGAKVISDTWGHAMGETEEAKTPIAVAGRVLVYPYRDRNKYHAGMCVCTAPGGTVDIMSRYEIITHPDAIVGIVSEIPDYEEWGEGKAKVDGRIWIYIK